MGNPWSTFRLTEKREMMPKGLIGKDKPKSPTTLRALALEVKC